MTCSLVMFGEQHMMYRTLSLDGNLKTAMKEVKKWGFMGMKYKNVAALVGTLDGEEVMITLMATPKTNTLFSVAVIYEGSDQWNELLSKYKTVNTFITTKYGEPSEVINQWESPYSLENSPIEAFKNGKAQYGTIYTTPEGKVSVNIICAGGKMSTMVTYIDEKNAVLFEQEGGKEFDFLQEEL